MTEVLITCGIVLVLLILSGFFSGSETALTAASRARMHQASKQGNRRADIVNRLHEQKDRLIGAILLGNNLVNILASALATSVMLKIFGDAGVVYATLVMTMLVLVFAEVLPKTYALVHSDKVALFVAPAIDLVVKVFSPIVAAVQWLVRVTLGLFGVVLSHEVSSEHHEEELRGVIDLHNGSEPEIEQERQMLRSILDLDDVEVGEIMTHRRNVAMLNIDSPLEKSVDDVLASQYTRFPIYRGDIDEITGVVHAKALLREMRNKKGKIAGIDLEAIAASPWFIPDSTSLLDQLQAFRARREHFALVIDEYGTFMGIVTLEDILEEIVGDISDETDDVGVPGVRQEPDGSYIVDGTVTLRDLDRDLGWVLPDDDASTLAGLILHEARMIPNQGQTFIFFGFRFEILRRLRNQITSIKVIPPADSDENDDQSSESDIAENSEEPETTSKAETA